MLAPFICALFSGCAAAVQAPTVDLGYGLWQSTVNETGGYYNFSNIRYAQPPLGNLRFAKPVKPLVDRSKVNDGQDGRICIQGQPSWDQERALLVKAYTTDPNNLTAFTQVPAPGINPTATPPGQSDGRATEDCLFLDVIVPQGVYDNATLRANGGAPVMMWTFGGGFYLGNKASQGNPAGFVGRSIANPATAPGIVYVAINYRLGAFGWLSGPSFTSSGGTPNAGFYDQRLALEWIQENIHLFGGDPKKVTMMGESAGASSTLHQITAYGGSQGDAPFQQAILVSPAYQPNPYNVVQESTFNNFLKAANVSTLAQLRNASSQALINANELTIFQSAFGTSGGYGPVVDGDFVPQLPTLLIAQGRYSKNVVNVLAGHGTDEGLIFTNPAIQNETAFNAFVNGTSSPIFPDAQPAIKNQIASILYPPGNSSTESTLGYNTTYTRTTTLEADFLINCNAQLVLEAFGANRTHGWLFSEGGGLHSEITPYVFNTGGPMEDIYGLGQVNTTTAVALQNWMVTFGVTGSPNAPGQPSMPVYGANHTLGSLSNAGAGLPVPDTALKQRCDFWNKPLYF